MANDKKFVVKKGLVAPNVDFANGGGSITATYLSTSNTLSFSGNTGQLFSITDSMSGTIFSVNDISGIPSIEVIDTGAVKIAETFGTVAIGADTVSGYKLYVNGNTLFGNSVTLNSTLIANGSVGTSGFVLTSNGTGVYWAAANSAIASVATANNSTYAYGKQESQLSVAVSANATFATTANNALRLNGKQESQLSVSEAITSTTALNSNNSTYAYGKQESQLSVSFSANASFASSANNSLYIGGFNAAYFTNANNITTGTLSEARLPYRMNQDVRTTDSVTFKDVAVTSNAYFSGKTTAANSFTLTNNSRLNFNTLNGNTVYMINQNDDHFVLYTTAINGSSRPVYAFYANSDTTNFELFLPLQLNSSVSANGSFGSAGQVLTSSGSGVYWSTVSGGGGGGATYTFGTGLINTSNTITVNAAYIATITANNSLYAYGKQESQLSVANAVFATTANNSLRFNGKQESQLSVANAVFATTANNSLRFNGKQESQLSVANAVFATTANNSIYAYGKQESQLSVANAAFATTSNNALYLDGFDSTYFTNASNITTGTLPEAQLPYRMNQDVRTTDSVTFANLTITGSVIVTGNVTTWNSNNVQISDSMIYLNANSTLANPDIGFTANYNDGVYRHAGFFRDASDGVWKVFDQYLPEPDISPYIDTANSSFRIADLQANVLTISSANIGGTLLTNLSYGGTANNSTYAYGKQESQLSVATSANAVFATTANNSLRFNGKQESQLSVANAIFAQSTDIAATSNNSSYLDGRSWQSPYAIGTTVANTGAFTLLSVSANVDIDSGTLFVDTTTNRVGIGNNTPGQTLQVDGSIGIKNGLVANGVIGANGTVLTSNGSTIYWGTITNGGGGGATYTFSTGLTNTSNTITVNAAYIATITSNNSTYAYGKQESQLSVAISANAVFATTANNSLYAYGKQESQLSVASAVTVSGAVESANNSSYLNNRTWETAGAIGIAVANTGAFTTLTVSDNVGIGNTTPGSKLTVNGVIETTTGGIKFPDGTTQTTAATGGGGGGGNKYSTNIGNTSGSSFNISHTMNTPDIVVSVRENSSGYFVYPDIRYADTNNVVIEFSSAPSANQYYVSIIGV